MARLAGVERPGFSFASLVFAAVKRKIGRVVTSTTAEVDDALFARLGAA